MKVNTQALSRPVFRGALILRKHGPTIAFVGGVTGVVTSTVLACRATLKLSDQLPQMQSKLESARSDDNGKKVAKVYADNVATVVKLYAPATIVGVASITALTGSHIVLNKRNASLTAGYAALSKAYDEYRDRVRDEIGEDREGDLYRGIRVEKVETEDGKKEIVRIADPNKLSPYARFFDEFSTEWHKDAELNRIFLQCQQNYFNMLLQSRGHVFLNDVYDGLGLERTGPGSVVGWVISEDGDNYVDFGLFSVRSSSFIDGHEPRILLDFNVDGVIWDKI